MVVLILIYCIRNPDCFLNVLRYIEKKLSLYVYVIQYANIEVLDFLSGKIVPQQFTLINICMAKTSVMHFWGSNSLSDYYKSTRKVNCYLPGKY